MSITLSVIIPTRNRSYYVAELLDSLASQEKVEFDWEVIVIDNGSTDQTEEMVSSKSISLPIKIRYCYESKLGLHNGRHRGLQEAQGEFIAYLDDDILVTPTWIHGVEKILAGKTDAVVGRILPKWEAEPPAWLSILVKESAYSGYLSILDLGSITREIDPVYVYGDNFFIKTNTIRKLGGFNPDSLPEDQLRYRGDGEYGMMLKFKRTGFQAWYDPLATAYHRVPSYRMNLKYLCKRSFAQGISDSYTQIRAEALDPSLLPENLLSSTTNPPKNAKYYWNRVAHIKLNEVWSTLKIRTLQSVPMTQTNVKTRLRKAWWSGYQFHQKEVKNDPELLSWVLRGDYWDAVPE